MIEGKKIQIRSLTKVYHSLRRGRIKAVDDINIDIDPGEFCVFVGPSGCGKSTLLNIISGLEKPTHGTISFDDQLVASVDKKYFQSPKERNVAMVFQSYALYPHMTVFDNIAFPLKLAKTKKQEIKEKVEEAAIRLEILDLLPARPKELSGGQRQRVAIARAIVRHPFVFLLDEPLSNLDAQLRTQMRAELKELQRKLAVTTVYVTHDQLEAMTLASKLAVMDKGRIQQTGKPFDIYQEPINTFVASFIGTPPMNLIKASVENINGTLHGSFDRIKIALPVDINKNLFKININKIIVGIRPENIELPISRESSNGKGKIKLIETLGDGKIVHIQTETNALIMKVSAKQSINEGDDINFYIHPSNLKIFNLDGLNIKGV